jgi:hypothetical protein
MILNIYHFIKYCIALAYFCFYHIKLVIIGRTTFDDIFQITDNSYDLG